MPILGAGKYRARTAESEADIRACQELRYLCFVERRGLATERAQARLDSDAFDTVCQHVLVEETCSRKLACCFRLMPLNNGREIARSYSAQYYDLSRLATYPDRMVEVGRFCIHPAHQTPCVLRTAWSAMSRFVDAHGVELIFGCSSFDGIDAEAHMDAFALLKERHLGPKCWLPRAKAPEVLRFARMLRQRPADPKTGLRRMPPLLRSYLGMGGWVSDHAVIDSELNTLHVFTGVEVRRVPPGRARVLRRAGA